MEYKISMNDLPWDEKQGKNFVNLPEKSIVGWNLRKKKLSIYAIKQTLRNMKQI